MYSVAITPLMRRYSPFRISALVLALGWLPIAAVGIPQTTSQSFHFGALVWIGFAFAVVGPLFLTNILWFTAISRVGPSRASLFSNLQPALGVAFAILLLGEHLTRWEVIGGVADPLGGGARALASAGCRAAGRLTFVNLVNVSLRERLHSQPPGYNLTIGRILAIYAGLMVTLALAALDQTIVATALPRIVGDLGGITQYSWVFTAYMLTSTVTVPLYGKLGDVYGRKKLFLFSIVVFLIGSALCGAAQSMTQLVVFRAIQGIGAGGLFPLSLAVIGNIVPPRDRGRWQGLIGAVFAAASIIGPAVGGFIVDNTTWRWVFFVNLPVGGLALIVISLTMPRRAARTEHAIDWLGAGVLAAGTGSLLLGLVWGGRQYAWGSGHVVLALAAAVVLLVVFGVVERRAPEPILPFDVLRNPIVAGSVACMALVGMAMFGTISYVPLFVQGVIGTSATSSGVVLTPMILGAVCTSILTGQLVSRTGRYRWNAVLGPVVLTGGDAPALADERRRPRTARRRATW